MFVARELVPIAVLLIVGTGCGGGPAARAASSSSSPPPAVAPPATVTPSCPPASSSIDLTAKGTAFDTDCIVVPAGEAFTIQLVNGDAGVPHNVAIHSLALADTFFKGKIITGVANTTYHVKGLRAGTYLFHCDVHPTKMNGTLTAGP